jgi:uncharacterized protein
MLIILSPSKSLKYSPIDVLGITKPRLFDKSKKLLEILKKHKKENIAQLMGISDKLAQLNYDRFQNFSDDHNVKNSFPAILLFKGDVYTDIDVTSYSSDDFSFMQDHVRILSGLYGLLQPLDLMQEYRLEMGTNLKNEYGNNLYKFWGDDIAYLLNKDIEKLDNQYIVNLASEEYTKSINFQKLNMPVINIIFKDLVKNEYKIIGLFAKRARGAMTDFIVRNKINNINDIKSFNGRGYKFSQDLSNDEQYVFLRDKSA